MTTEEEQKQQKSYIYIEFEDATSISTKQFNVSNVSPFQLWAFAKYFEYKANQLMMGMEAQQLQMMREHDEMNKIVVPKPKLKL